MKRTEDRAPGSGSGPDDRPAGSAAAIGRSLDLYYRDAARNARMDRLNADFVTQGDLAFDIGAHVGDRVASFLRLGASVVALEPQVRVFRALRLIHGRQTRATLLPVAVGAQDGTASLHLNPGNPTVATLAAEFVEAARGAPGWQDQVWDRTVSVPVTTLDALIDRYGMPAFVKIDVEGHEADVLRGLSRAIPALSFEFTTIQRGAAADCVARLREMGDYAYNFSLGEDHMLRQDAWFDGETLIAMLDALPPEANSGDVYARLRSPMSG